MTAKVIPLPARPRPLVDFDNLSPVEKIAVEALRRHGEPVTEAAVVALVTRAAEIAHARAKASHQ